MQQVQISNADWVVLNEIVGEAMLSEDKLRMLLVKNDRQTLLRQYSLSDPLRIYITSLADMANLAELANILYLLRERGDTPVD